MNTFSNNFIIKSNYKTIGYDPKISVPHHDDTIEIIQFWSNGGYFIARNNIFPITPNSIILVNAIESHYSNPSIVSKYNRSKIVISAEYFHKICSLCNLTSLSCLLEQKGGLHCSFLPTQKSSVHSIDLLFHEVFQIFTSQEATPSAQADIISCIIRILSFFANTPLAPMQNTENDNMLLRMTEYINTQLHSWNEVTLNNMCSALHISPSYASHLFKNLTNKSITQYAMDLRISESKKMLLTTDLKISDIAEMLNFKDSTTFCKTFKKHTGCTPRTYKLSNGTTSQTID